MSSRVFIIQAPSGKNLEPAKDHGELTVMLDGRESTTLARSKLDAHLRNFTADDYLLLIGSPIFIALACMILNNKVPYVKLLVWSRESQTYNSERIPC